MGSALVGGVMYPASFFAFTDNIEDHFECIERL